MAQAPTRFDSFADGGGQGDTEPGAPASPGPGRSWADVFGTAAKPATSSPPMPPMPWEDAAAAPAPSWTAPIERFLASAAASLSAATQPPPPPPKASAATVRRLYERAVALHDAGRRADGVARREIRAAYRRLALEHHPDGAARALTAWPASTPPTRVLDSPRARRVVRLRPAVRALRRRAAARRGGR